MAKSSAATPNVPLAMASGPSKARILRLKSRRLNPSVVPQCQHCDGRMSFQVSPARCSRARYFTWPLFITLLCKAGIQTFRFNADWSSHGLAKGPIRAKKPATRPGGLAGDVSPSSISSSRSSMPSWYTRPSVAVQRGGGQPSELSRVPLRGIQRRCSGIRENSDPFRRGNPRNSHESRYARHLRIPLRELYRRIARGQIPTRAGGYSRTSQRSACGSAP